MTKKLKSRAVALASSRTRAGTRSDAMSAYQAVNLATGKDAAEEFSKYVIEILHELARTGGDTIDKAKCSFKVESESSVHCKLSYRVGRLHGYSEKVCVGDYPKYDKVKVLMNLNHREVKEFIFDVSENAYSAAERYVEMLLKASETAK